jgi:transposase
MIKVQLNSNERDKLEKIRKRSSSRDSERLLMVLLSNEGCSPPKIGEILKRNPHTVRHWLKRFIQKGIEGLSRKFSSGRPRDKRGLILSVINDILLFEPTKFGYVESVWSICLIAHHLKEQYQMTVSCDTIERALKEAGFTYKRPSKTVSRDAPSKEEKLRAVEVILTEIKELLVKEELEVFALDESHFSNEPYLIRGWFKKRWPPQDLYTKKARTFHSLWFIESTNTKILLEKISRV